LSIISIHLVKFAQIWISHPRGLGQKNCTAGVANCYHAWFTCVRYGIGLCNCVIICLNIRSLSKTTLL